MQIRAILRGTVAIGLVFCAVVSRPSMRLGVAAETAPSRTGKPSGPSKAPAVEITLDTSAAPDMAEWAARVKGLCEKAYPMICEHLGAADFAPPTKAKIIFKKMNGIAFTSGTTITCGAEWFKAHPSDEGAVIHEMCHVVQAYGPRHGAPLWITEGIADYVRWFNWEPKDRQPRVDPQRAKYTHSYQTSAAFFDWIVRKKDKSFVNRLNSAIRKGEYNVDLFQKLAGKPLDDLWAEFVESEKREPSGARQIPAVPMGPPTFEVRVPLNSKRMQELFDACAKFHWNPKDAAEYEKLGDLAGMMTVLKHVQAAPGGLPEKDSKALTATADQAQETLKQVAWERKDAARLNRFALERAEKSGGVLFSATLVAKGSGELLLMKFDGVDRRVLVKVPTDVAKSVSPGNWLVLGLVGGTARVQGPSGEEKTPVVISCCLLPWKGTKP